MEHALIEDLDSAIALASRSRRNDHLERVTDLFLRDAPRLSDEQIDLFDVVIARLASAIEVRARYGAVRASRGCSECTAGCGTFSRP